jgi:hypothetical protein
MGWMALKQPPPPYPHLALHEHMLGNLGPTRLSAQHSPLLSSLGGQSSVGRAAVLSFESESCERSFPPVRILILWSLQACDCTLRRLELKLSDNSAILFRPN